MKMLILLMSLADGAVSGEVPDVQLLDFTASYCQPCQQMVPVLQRMERDKFPVRRIDITEEPELARRFRVDRVPTLVLMVEGQEAKRFVGLTDEAELRAEMNRAARRLAESRGAVIEPAPVVTENLSDETAGISSPEPSSGDRPSVKDIVRGLLVGEKRTVSLENPTMRAQSPEGQALTGLDAASAATVRVRVAGVSTKDGSKIQDVGTGTIVYSAEGQAIILTVAHVFLDIATKNADITIEVFENGRAIPYKGQLIGGDHNADLAFLKIQTSKIMPSVRLSAEAPKLTKGQPLVSFGCNGGADPTRMETKIADINRYDGPANLVCTSDPQSGRSGGGLFSTKGELVGVCSCADRKQREGLYMAYEPIAKLVSSLKLQSILMSAPGSVGEDAASTFASLLEQEAGQSRQLSQNPSPAESAPAKPSPMTARTEELVDAEAPAFDEFSEVEDESPGKPSDSLPEPTEVAMSDEGELSDAPLFDPRPKKPSAGVSRTAEVTNADLASPAGPEITIVIDDKRPGSQKRVIVIPQASPYIMQLLTGEVSDPSAAASLSAARPAVTATSSRKSARPAASSGSRNLIP